MDARIPNRREDRDPSLDQYLREMGETPLLTAAEEVSLAKQIKEGDQTALERLIKANLRFVVFVAKQYQNLGLPLADLINAGNTGLIKAAKHFDETRGFRFITYAVWWIRQAIQETLTKQKGTICLPVEAFRKGRQVERRAATLRQRLGKEPTLGEISEESGISQEELARITQENCGALSLDEPFGDGDERTPSDILESDTFPSPKELLLQAKLSEEIKKALDSLPLTPGETQEKRDQKIAILELHYGLVGLKPLGLKELSEHFQLPRQKVQEKILEMIRRLRHSSVAPELKRLFHEL